VRGQRHAPAAFYPWERPSTHCTGGWLGHRAGLDRCGKSRPTGIRSPDCPGRSQSLYQLSYPAHIYIYIYITPIQMFLDWCCHLSYGVSPEHFCKTYVYKEIFFILTSHVGCWCCDGVRRMFDLKWYLEHSLLYKNLPFITSVVAIFFLKSVTV
jgi:hypothetical protein